MEDLLHSLNEAQRSAVTATEGFVRVLAGAGSGKTRALAGRYAYLVSEIGVLPKSILCVTFTNKSANEMRERIRRMTAGNDTGNIDTFHSFCVTVLQEDANAVGYPKSFLVLDNADIDSMLTIVYEERGLTLRDRTFGNARDRIEILKCKEKPDYYEALVALSLGKLYETYQQAETVDDIIFYGYLYQQKKCFGLDYNDLINFVLYLLDHNEEIREKWQKRLEYIMVDEFQDIDELQYRLMQRLCGYHKNLFVVGDPDQTIYTWRGANVKYLLDFDRQFPGTKTILMMQNYRSTPEILRVANSLIEKNLLRVKKELIPTIGSGAPVVYNHLKTAQDEAAWIAAEIEGLHEKGVAYQDVTILYRAHYVSRVLEEVFLEKKLPYTLYSGVQFFCRREIKDTLSYLRMLVYKDDLAFTRVVNTPKRNVGERRMRFLKERAAETEATLYETLRRNLDDSLFSGTKARAFVELIERYAAMIEELPISELVTKLLDESGYEALLRTEGSQDRLDNLAELKQAIYEYETGCGEERSLENYLNHVALFTNADAGAAKDAVKLMTVHTAKGLEFPYVFLCAFEEGVFPSKKTATREGMEEERRLAFVAITRAEQGLYLSDAEGRNLDGSFRYPSRFLFDIDKGLLSVQEGLPESLISEARWRIAASERQLASAEGLHGFAVGDRVRHNIMGEGTVQEIDQTAGAALIQFDLLDTPRRLGSLARLEKID